MSRVSGLNAVYNVITSIMGNLSKLEGLSGDDPLWAIDRHGECNGKMHNITMLALAPVCNALENKKI